MKLVVFVVALIAHLLALVSSTDYCSPTLCGTNITHIGCNNTDTYGPDCPVGAAKIVLTTEMKQELVRAHNLKRNLIAAGNLTDFLPATRMATIRWNAELAYLAELNVIRCIFAHDMCRKTDAFPWSGQNLGITTWTGPDPVDLTVMLGHIDAWWSEYVDANMTQIDSYPASTNATIGHFTVMTSEKNTAVGCAAVKFLEPDNSTSLITACNYARTNIIGYKMYQSGATGSKCTTGMNPNYLALCSLSEPYNVKAA